MRNRPRAALSALTDAVDYGRHSGGLDIPTPAFCERCHGSVRTRFDTNGDGALVQFVEPCPLCRRRALELLPLAKAKPVPPPGRVRPAKPRTKYASKPAGWEPLCQICGCVVKWKKRGRPPLYCDDHNPQRRRV